MHGKEMRTFNQTNNEKEEKLSIMSTFYIGIDPDTDKNGVALLNTETRKITIQQLDFAHTLEYIRRQHDVLSVRGGHGFKVIIEAGWMNKGNWHLRRWDGRAVSAAKGVDQGRNEQTSRLLGEMMAYYGIPYEFKRPLPKCWKGGNRKITREELEEVTAQTLGRQNQEGRDAALLAWDKAGLPVRVSVRGPQMHAARKPETAGKVKIFDDND